MKAEYIVGDKVVFYNTFKNVDKEYVGIVKSVESESMEFNGKEIVLHIRYTIESDSFDGLIETNRYWTILRKVEEPTLEERISTIEERLGVLDNHVKKYIVDKVEEVDTVGGFEYLKDNYGNGYLLLENRELVKIYDVVE